MKILIGFALGLAIGAASRWFEIPVPAPPRLIGALLVVSITVGYMLTDRWITSRNAPAPSAQIGGVQDGKP